MITAQDIREKTFEKSRLSGYDVVAVDDFLEELADEISAAQKENAVLKSKMKVLVDKIEEYRANEEALNLALLSAQKLAVQIEAEARQRADAMLAEAEAQVKARTGSIEDEIELQNTRLSEATASTAKFFDAVRALCNAQLKNLDTISAEILPEPEVPETAGEVVAPAEEDDSIISSIEDNVARIQPEPSFDLDLDAAPEADNAKASGFASTQQFTL